MKNNILKINIVVLSVLMLTAAACAPADTIGQLEPAVAVTTKENDTNNQAHWAVQIDTDTALTEAEIEGLLFMREEEKLAGDVYRYLYEQWGSPVFSNIA